MRIFQISFYSSSQSTFPSFLANCSIKRQIMFFVFVLFFFFFTENGNSMLLESKLESTQWNSLCRSFQDNFIHLRGKNAHSFGTQLKDFTTSIIYTSLILGRKGDANILQKQSFLKQHQRKNSKCLKINLSVLLTLSPYVVTGGGSNWRPWRRKVCSTTCCLDLGVPLPVCPPQSPTVRITPCQWGAHRSRLLSCLSRLDYWRGWLLFPTVRLLFLL